MGKQKNYRRYLERDMWKALQVLFCIPSAGYIQEVSSRMNVVTVCYHTYRTSMLMSESGGSSPVRVKRKCNEVKCLD